MVNVDTGVFCVLVVPDTTSGHWWCEATSGVSAKTNGHYYCQAKPCTEQQATYVCDGVDNTSLGVNSGVAR